MKRLLVGLLLSVMACHQPPVLNFEEMEVPKSEGALFPSLFAAGNQVWLSYLYEPDTTSFLMLTHWQKDAWQEPEVVAQTEDNDWFVNWADFPSVYRNEDQLLTYMLTKSGAAAYAYDISLFYRNVDEQNWLGPIIPHRDSTQTEHGFVSLFPFQDSLTGMAWLDGRNYVEMQIKAEDGLIEPEMMLRFTTIDKNGHLGADQLLDPRVCSCCQTDAAVIPGGVVLVYRDRSEAEVRDISYLRYTHGQWSEPMSLSAENWVISGCPVNGPAVDAFGESVAATWYTQANDIPEVWLSFSQDTALTFSAPLRVDNGHPLGRLDLKMIDEDTAVVCWMEEWEEQAQLMVALMTPSGKIAEQKIAEYPSSRGGGFPRLAISGRRIIWITWTALGDTTEVHVARTQLK